QPALHRLTLVLLFYKLDCYYFLHSYWDLLLFQKKRNTKSVPLFHFLALYLTHYFFSKIILSFFKAFSHLIANKASNAYFFAYSSNLFVYYILNCLIGILNKRLFQKTNILVVLSYPAFYYFFNNFLRLSFV